LIIGCGVFLNDATIDRNYAEFVSISKDISTLENEMLELKSILEEWKAVPGSLEIASSIHSDVVLCLSTSSFYSMLYTR
jgi:hypothetical protein